MLSILVVEGAFLVNVEKYFEGSILFKGRYTDLVEYLAFEALLGGGAEVRIEFEELFKDQGQLLRAIPRYLSETTGLGLSRLQRLAVLESRRVSYEACVLWR